MKILKFGGTSVGAPERIETVIALVREAREKSPVAVVVSAFGGATDRLIEMAKKAADGDLAYKELFIEFEKRHLAAVHALVPIKSQAPALATVKMMLNELEDILHGTYLVGEYTERTLDFIMSFGERLSAFIIAEAFKAKGTDAEYCDARDLVKTDNRYGAAGILQEETYRNIRTYFLNRGALQVITGFIGSTLKGETTTLGRGGSDYTAAIFGAALHASEIQIWTDVDGFMTADPRKVKDAFPIPQMSYREALEMSNSGAKVLYPPTVQPAMLQNIPIRILNTFNPSFQGTLITASAPERKVSVCGISSLDDVAVLRIEGSGLVRAIGTAKRVFSALANENVNVIFISQASSEHSICFAVALKDAERAKAAVEKEFHLEIAAGKIYPIDVETNLSIVAVVGENMKHRTGVAGWFFQTLGKNGINVVAIAQGSSEMNISVVINRADEEKALNALHEVFFLSKRKTLHLFLVGTGLIGGTFLRQLDEHSKALREQQSLEIKVVALARSKKMVFNPNGIDLKCWKTTLEERGEPKDMKEFVRRMKSLNLSGSVFIDCTAADEVVEHYEEILSSSISVVTPNKRANSGKYEDYKKLKLAAIQHDVKYLYETNVGAGLPVINTLNDLLSSGDKILKIEAVLSGSLSYIFNNFKGERNFSDVVREAMRLGYTEPDPREDLSGLDVARKILILARETGLPLELSDVKVENILPDPCLAAKTVEEFFVELEKANPMFEERKRQAEEQKRVLRFIASLENGEAQARLAAIDAEHPFYALSGSDNIIAYTTERYRERPLVVKGAGAGAEVTAAGVFANVIWISNYLF
ncbi:MAG: bifunctional aspartate kinase/homoserine dehydrogenase I [Chloroherpetonaceae bacterium]|nr:bifunctional aspartate kinase/homoserine dehydrogenase I [Chloroherpetonaceae bacterium]MDW8437196.1 bifunctional aspartate kinase/homoserine dehydrogenase I [Chloroherpetonaceae bacterium]